MKMITCSDILPFAFDASFMPRHRLLSHITSRRVAVAIILAAFPASPREKYRLTRTMSLSL